MLPEEQTRAQPFEADLIVEADLSRASQSDELADTIDYGALIALVTKIISTERHQLLERVAGRILEETLRTPGVEAAEVVVRKLRPPVPQDVAHSAVRLRRQC